MLHEVLTYGTRWAHIASCHSPNRTTLALKNRYSTLRLKNETKARNSKTSSDPSNDFDSPGAPTSDHQSWDEEDEGEDLDEIRCAATESWLEDLGHANKNTEGNAPQGHSAQTDAGTSKMRVTTVPIPEPPQPSLDWDYWANCKYNGLPAPHYPADNVNPQLEAVHISPGEAAAAKVDNYLQLRSPMLLSQSEHHQSSSANSSYFNPMEDDGSRRHNQAPAQTQPEILTPPYLLGKANPKQHHNLTDALLTHGSSCRRLQLSQNDFRLCVYRLPHSRSHHSSAAAISGDKEWPPTLELCKTKSSAHYGERAKYDGSTIQSLGHGRHGDDPHRVPVFLPVSFLATEWQSNFANIAMEPTFSPGPVIAAAAANSPRQRPACQHDTSRSYRPWWYSTRPEAPRSPGRADSGL